MKDAQKQKSTIAIAISFFLIIASITGTWFLYREMQAIKTEIQTIREGIASLEAENGAIRDFQAVRSRRADDIGRINKFFIEKDRPLDFIESLEYLGRITQTALAIDAGGMNKESDYFTFRLAIDGNQKNTFKFLSLLERMPYTILVSSLAVSNLERDLQNPEAQHTRLSLTIKARTK